LHGSGEKSDPRLMKREREREREGEGGREEEERRGGRGNQKWWLRSASPSL
jgi:hypothetical protein